MSWLNGMVPVEVIGAEEPVGRLTKDIGGDSLWVKNVDSEVIWSVAPLSKIQGLEKTELIEAWDKLDVPTVLA